MTNENIDIHSVGGLIYNHKKDILIQYHNKYNCWTIPMGKVENDLNLLETIKKEFKEELDIEVLECNEVASKKFIYENINPKDWTFTDGGMTFTALFHLFKIGNWCGVIKNNEPDKHAELKFVSLDTLRTMQPVSDALKVFFDYIDNKTMQC